MRIAVGGKLLISFLACQDDIATSSSRYTSEEFYKHNWPHPHTKGNAEMDERYLLVGKCIGKECLVKAKLCQDIKPYQCKHCPLVSIAQQIEQQDGGNDIPVK